MVSSFSRCDSKQTYGSFEKGCLTGKSLRDNVAGYGYCWFLRLFEWTSRCFSVVERNSTTTCIRSFSFLVVESLWTSINQNQTLTTHNANRHCRVRCSTFVWQSLSKQLYVHINPLWFRYPVLKKFVASFNDKQCLPVQNRQKTIVPRLDPVLAERPQCPLCLPMFCKPEEK